MEKRSSAGTNREAKAHAAGRHPPDSKDANKASPSSSTVVNNNANCVAVAKDVSRQHQHKPQPLPLVAASSSSSNPAAALMVVPYSSRAPQVSRVICNIYNKAIISMASRDGEIKYTDLDGLIDHISELIQLKKEKPPTKSFRFLNVMEMFSAEMTDASDLRDISPSHECSEARTIAISLLKGIGKVHGATAGLLLIAHVLERYDTLSDNKYECLNLLKEMNILAKNINKFSRLTTSTQEMVAETIKESIQLVLEGSILCCTHLKSSKISKFFKASAKEKELNRLKQQVVTTYSHLITTTSITTLVVVDRRSSHRQIYRELDKYPKYAVGIEEPVKKIIELLQWGSQKRTATVILHGFGGMGKTTLAEAVYSSFSRKDCKCSWIRLCKDTDSCSDIAILQMAMLKDLMGADKQVPDIKTFEDGRRFIGHILEKEPAFICIDNVLSEKRLQQLLPLPSDLDKAKKLRLLITAHDTNIRNVLGTKMCTKLYKVKPIPYEHASDLVKGLMHTQKKDPAVIKEIVEKSGGVPLLLEKAAKFIGAADDKQKACRIFREESEKLSGQIFGEGDDLLDYNRLPEDLKDPLLDICSFFHGWRWEAVEDIMGISILDRLEKRSLVTREARNKVAVPDVILRIAIQKSKGTRITGANAIQEFLNATGNKEEGIKGLSFTEDPGVVSISAKKLDRVLSSLRVLALKNSTIGNYNKIFQNLIFLDAGKSPLPSNVSTFKELRYLSYLPQKQEDLNLSKMPPNIKRLKLNGRMYSYSNVCSVDLHGLQNLKTLQLLEFKHLAKLPKELGFLKCLEFLNITDCCNFEELPTNLGDLNALKFLTVEKCPKLQNLPESISKLTSLNVLELCGCDSLKRLPKGFESLCSLRTLYLNGTGLEVLPISFGSLSSLQELNLKGTSLQELPSSFEKLSKLKVLNLASCLRLMDLPDGLGKLTSLVELNLIGCGELKRIPKGNRNRKLTWLFAAMEKSISGHHKKPHAA